jgi:hypothetical protein
LGFSNISGHISQKLFGNKSLRVTSPCDSFSILAAKNNNGPCAIPLLRQVETVAWSHLHIFATLEVPPNMSIIAESVSFNFSIFHSLTCLLFICISLQKDFANSNIVLKSVYSNFAMPLKGI